MKPRLVGLSWHHLDYGFINNLEPYGPDIEVEARADIGPVDNRLPPWPSDTFSFWVATPAAIYNSQPVEFERSAIHILPVVDEATVTEYINGILTKCEGKNWEVICLKLQLHFEYEFQTEFLDSVSQKL